MRITCETDLSALHFPYINRRDPRDMMVFNHRQMQNTLIGTLSQIDEDLPIPKGWKDTGRVFQDGGVVREDTEKINGKIVVTAIHRHTHHHASNAHIVDGMWVKTEYPNKIPKIRR